MIVGSHIPPEPKPLHRSCPLTLKAKGVRLPPQQLKDLKAIALQKGMTRGRRVMGDNEWRSLLDHTQHLFWALHPSQLG